MATKKREGDKRGREKKSSALPRDKETSMIPTDNENSNGNALAWICQMFNRQSGRHK